MLYNLLVEIPGRMISRAELRRNNGDPGRRNYIAYQGVVYDVTDCPRWRLDLHEHLRFPGQDLTSLSARTPRTNRNFSRGRASK